MLFKFQAKILGNVHVAKSKSIVQNLVRSVALSGSRSGTISKQRVVDFAMRFCQCMLFLTLAASPMAKGAFGTVWAIQNGPSIPCSLKAYIGHPHELIFSKLLLPHHIVDVILQFGGAVNDYLLVVSTPSQYNFDVWAMWAHHLYDISEAFGIRAYNRRFLGSWN